VRRRPARLVSRQELKKAKNKHVCTMAWLTCVGKVLGVSARGSVGVEQVHGEPIVEPALVID
jgi:hypothetical protein